MPQYYHQLYELGQLYIDEYSSIDLRNVYYDLAQILNASLDPLSDKEKDDMFKYLLLAGDIKEAKVLRNNIFWTMAGYPGFSIPFDISNDVETFKRLAALIKECKK